MNTKFEIGDWRLGIWSLKWGLWDLEFGLWDFRFGIWLLGFGISLVVTACASAAPTPTPPPQLPTISGPTEIQVAVAASDFLPGAPRVPFVLFDGTHPIADAKAVKVYAFDLATPSAPQAGWGGAAASYSDYEIPYWVVHPELPRAGVWGLGVEIAKADGRTVQSQFTIQVVETIASPAVGGRPPASRNRTLATEPDIHKLTSGLGPVPALYQITVADALKSGKPTVVVFASPGFCASRLCAPVVNSVEAVHKAQPEAANYIHLEVYKSFNPLVGSDEMEEWHLVSEPWIFILDKTGKVAARLGGPVSPRELTEALTPLITP